MSGSAISGKNASDMRRPSLLQIIVFALMFGVAPFSTLAVWLLLPYLLWVTFAAFLNLTIVRMNRPFGGAARAHAERAD